MENLPGEYPDERPEWEQEPEQIPPALREKWKQQEKKGLSAGPCQGCGTILTEDQISCPICEARNEQTYGIISGLASFFKSPWGLIAFALILLAIISFLIY